MVRGLPKGTSAATYPVRVFEQWVRLAKITSGPIFRPINRRRSMREGSVFRENAAAAVG